MVQFLKIKLSYCSLLRKSVTRTKLSNIDGENKIKETIHFTYSHGSR